MELRSCSFRPRASRPSCRSVSGFVPLGRRLVFRSRRCLRVYPCRLAARRTRPFFGGASPAGVLNVSSPPTGGLSRFTPCRFGVPAGFLIDVGCFPRGRPAVVASAPLPMPRFQTPCPCCPLLDAFSGVVSQDPLLPVVRVYGSVSAWPLPAASRRSALRCRWSSRLRRPSLPGVTPLRCTPSLPVLAFCIGACVFPIFFGATRVAGEWRDARDRDRGALDAARDAHSLLLVRVDALESPLPSAIASAAFPRRPADRFS